MSIFAPSEREQVVLAPSPRVCSWRALVPDLPCSSSVPLLASCCARPISALQVSDFGSHSLLLQVPETALYLEPFGDDTLVELPGLSSLENLLREPLDLVGQDLAYTAVHVSTCAAATPAKMQSVSSLDSATSSTGERS